MSKNNAVEQSEGRGCLSKKQFTLAGGQTLTCPILTTCGYGAVIECQKEKWTIENMFKGIAFTYGVGMLFLYDCLN
ncbi:MAG: hypothetical protein K2N73_01540 [Lachnospiraceae bacterium]|nr:hypothetical protein [Lachnospiraceae bacterium]